MKRNHHPGFTLIELLVAATIIIVLTSIGLVSYQTSLRNGRNAKRKADLEVLRQAIMMYKADTGCYPDAGDITDLKTDLADYLSDADRISDPTGDNPYEYSDGGGTCPTSFTLTARLEPDNTPWSVSNP